MINHQAFRHSRAHGIGASGTIALSIILERPGITPSMLAREIGCSTANITCLLDRLEKHGWITRQRSVADRRIYLLHPTEQATQAFMREEAGHAV